MAVELELKALLIKLAQKYETPAFLANDPAKFMHRYETAREQEAAAFIAANMAFGRRDQILSHVEAVLKEAGGSPANWIEGGGYRSFFTQGAKSFYRMYTHNDFVLFFDALQSILQSTHTIGDAVRQRYSGGFLHQTLASLFPKECALVPHSASSAAKRLNMLSRWMVRRTSSVDLGLWNWFPATRLLIPLDTHVMQEARRLGLLNAKSASLKAAVELTELMREVFPDDPTRADFALFGLGVDQQAKTMDFGCGTL